MAFEIRQLKNDEYNQAIQLSNEIFRDEEHTSMGDAFPLVFSRNLHHSFGAFDNHQLIGFVGLVPYRMKIGEAVLQAFSLGSVCTNEQYRNRGLSSAILKEVYQYINQAQANLLLVSGDRGLYKRNHCYSYSQMFSFLISEVEQQKESSGIIRKANSTDLFSIYALREKKNVRYESSITEWKELIEASGYSSIFKMKQAVYICERAETIQSYVVIGLPNQNKRNKEEGIITDWGGSSESVHHILLYLLHEKVINKIKISVPWHDKLIHELKIYPYEKNKQEGTIHIVNPIRIIKQLMPYFKKRNSEPTNFYLTDENKLVLAYDDFQLKLTQEELVELLFTPNIISLPPRLKNTFPIPLPKINGVFYV